jgi:hypothetical protein
MVVVGGGEDAVPDPDLDLVGLDRPRLGRRVEQRLDRLDHLIGARPDAGPEASAHLPQGATRNFSKLHSTSPARPSGSAASVSRPES